MIDNDKMTPRKPLKNPMTWKGWKDWAHFILPDGEYYGHKPTFKLYTKEAFELEIDRLLTKGGFALAANQGRYATCSEIDFADALAKHMVKKTGLTEIEVRTGLYEGTLSPSS